MEVQKRALRIPHVTPPTRRSSRQEAKEVEKLKLAAKQENIKSVVSKPSKAKSVIKPTVKAGVKVKPASSSTKKPVKKPQPTTKRKTSSASPEEPTAKKPSKIAKTETEALTKHLEVGSALPNVELLDQDGKSVNLKKIARESGKTIVLFAYPKASTPGCTKQACGFRDNYKDFEAAGALVFGISADPPKAQNSFKTKQNLPYELLSDPDYKLISPLGAKKSPKGVIRSHWIFKGGKLVESAVGVSPKDSFTNALSSV